MRQLHPGHTALVVTEPYDAGPVFNVVIAPDPQVLRADTRLGQHSTGLGEHQAGAAYCSTREVNEVPGVGEAIGAGALAHRGDHDPAGQHQIANAEGIKQGGPYVATCLTKILLADSRVVAGLGTRRAVAGEAGRVGDPPPHKFLTF